MEKLVELLNEAKPLKKYQEYWYNGEKIKLLKYAEDYAESVSEDITEKVISKKFGFIWWLLKKDHVDLKKMFDDWYCVPISRGFVREEDKLSEFEMTVDDIVMYLSIQNNPVQSLISILK